VRASFAAPTGNRRTLARSCLDSTTHDCFHADGVLRRVDHTLMSGEKEEESDRDRMVTNIVVVIFLLALVGGGIWIANAMFNMRKTQDCVLSGRRNCAGVSVPAGDRY
jgi:hypothetical protein